MGGSDHDVTDGEHWDLDTLRSAVKYQQWLLASFGNKLSGNVLEIGGGNGNYTRWITTSASRVTLVEPDRKMCEIVRSLDLPRVSVIDSTIESFGTDHDPFDTIVMINVLEHIEDDAAATRLAFQLLSPGGHLCIAVPAHRMLFGSLDKEYGHFRRYRRDEVASIVTKAGFRLDSCHYFNPIGAIGWYVATRIGRAKKISRSNVAMSERLAVPLGKVLERLGAPPFGQSVIAIGVKPAASS